MHLTRYSCSESKAVYGSYTTETYSNIDRINEQNRVLRDFETNKQALNVQPLFQNNIYLDGPKKLKTVIRCHSF